MNLQLSGHHLDITPAIRSYIIDKLAVYHVILTMSSTSMSSCP
jgi:ribosome-associated translation inhibitor RaiA